MGTKRRGEPWLLAMAMPAFPALLNSLISDSGLGFDIEDGVTEVACPSGVSAPLLFQAPLPPPTTNAPLQLSGPATGEVYQTPTHVDSFHYLHKCKAPSFPVPAYAGINLALHRKLFHFLKKVWLCFLILPVKPTPKFLFEYRSTGLKLFATEYLYENVCVFHTVGQ